MLKVIRAAELGNEQFYLEAEVTFVDCDWRFRVASAPVDLPYAIPLVPSFDVDEDRSIRAPHRTVEGRARLGGFDVRHASRQRLAEVEQHHARLFLPMREDRFALGVLVVLIHAVEPGLVGFADAGIDHPLVPQGDQMPFDVVDVVGQMFAVKSTGCHGPCYHCTGFRERHAITKSDQVALVGQGE